MSPSVSPPASIAHLFRNSHLDPAVCALRLLFDFVSALLNIPTLLPLFIFDGKDRPEYKRGRHICRSEFAIEPELRSMCDAFGFPWWIAPGEAEWEMADLAKQGKIDACWTGDSDILCVPLSSLVQRALTPSQPRFPAPHLPTSLELPRSPQYRLLHPDSPPKIGRAHV